MQSPGEFEGDPERTLTPGVVSIETTESNGLTTLKLTKDAELKAFGKISEHVFGQSQSGQGDGVGEVGEFGGDEKLGAGDGPGEGGSGGPPPSSIVGAGVGPEGSWIHRSMKQSRESNSAWTFSGSGGAPNTYPLTGYGDVPLVPPIITSKLSPAGTLKVPV